MLGMKIRKGQLTSVFKKIRIKVSGLTDKEKVSRESVKGGRNMAKIVGLIIFSVAALVLAGCADMGPNTREGAVLGSAIGGVTGAVVGNQLGSALGGAAIGAGVGAITGGSIGSAKDAAYENRAQQPPSHTAYAAPPVEQSQATPPPGRWVTVPGQWIGGQWVPAHKVWIPINPE